MRPGIRLEFVLVASVACALLISFAARAEDAAPESETLQARIEQMRDDPSFRVAGARFAAEALVGELYARRGFTRAWTVPEARDDLLRAINDSEADGLDPEDYLRSALTSARKASEAADASLDAQIDYDLLQTEALVRLLYHVIFGKVDPKSFDPNWNFSRDANVGDPVVFVQGCIDSGELYARIEREKPQHEMYRNLKAELARMRAIAASGGWASVSGGPTLKAGARDPRVRELRARLAKTGELEADAPSDPLVFDAALAAALSSFQANHGLGADGALGPATLAALNVPVAAQVERLRVNLERGRWLLRDLGPTFVIVNVAGYEVYYLRDGKVVWSARAQVGKPYRKTPIFESMMTYLVLNPTWTVPPSILAQDILPAQRRDHSTLAKKQLEVIDHNGRAVPASSIDWARATPKNFPYMLRQQPGPANALGRVKFMFPNAYAVYLHDTPSRGLFDKSERAFSSGCIRVENPLELAGLLLEGQKGWDRAAIDRALEEGKTRSITLARPVPVLLSYWTAWVGRTGVLQVRQDIYGRDAKVAAGLEAKFSFRPRRS
jgi:murein L,D-transpeptidase YcbB/YkuD